jgi:hypothetical protein
VNDTFISGGITGLISRGDGGGDVMMRELSDMEMDL